MTTSHWASQFPCRVLSSLHTPPCRLECWWWWWWWWWWWFYCPPPPRWSCPCCLRARRERGKGRVGGGIGGRGGAGVGGVLARLAPGGHRAARVAVGGPVAALPHEGVADVAVTIGAVALVQEAAPNRRPGLERSVLAAVGEVAEHAPRRGDHFDVIVIVVFSACTSRCSSRGRGRGRGRGQSGGRS